MPISGIEGISSLNGLLGETSATTTADGESFANILTEALGNAGELEAVDNVSAAALLSEDASNLHNVVLETQKAQLAVDLAVQVRNRCVEAYNEILRMQV